MILLKINIFRHKNHKSIDISNLKKKDIFLSENLLTWATLMYILHDILRLQPMVSIKTFGLQIPEALQRVRLALQLCADDLQSLHLLALLLSAQKQYTEALSVLEAAVLQYPDDFK